MRTSSRRAGWRRPGCEVESDAAGNLLGRLRGTRPELPELWTGSHLDSVPQGGRLDGALGVVAGIEAVERIGRQERTLAVVAFRGEEVGCIGSRARCAESGVLPGAFLELHIEQGPRLERAGAPLAVVPSIVGYVRGTITTTGRASHAGTTPMDVREDALVAAAERVLAIRDAAIAIPDAVATVGQLSVEPGAANVVPAEVSFSVDARAPDRERLDALVAAIGFEPTLRVEPVAMDERVLRRGPRRDRRARSARRRAPLRCRPRRGHPRGRGRPERDALRPQPERRRQPLAGRALVRRGRPARDRRPRARATPSPLAALQPAAAGRARPASATRRQRLPASQLPSRASSRRCRSIRSGSPR